MPPVILTPTLLEETTAVYVATLVDEDGVAIPASLLATLTLTYYDRDTGLIVNTRDTQDVLNANDVTVDSAGVLTWAMQEEDTAIVSDYASLEVHRALFAWRWGVPLRTGRHEVDITVENLAKVP